MTRELDLRGASILFDDAIDTMVVGCGGFGVGTRVERGCQRCQYVEWSGAKAELTRDRFVEASGIDGQGQHDGSYRVDACRSRLMDQVYYQGNQPGQIPGLLTNGYFWWECGGMTVLGGM